MNKKMKINSKIKIFKKKLFQRKFFNNYLIKIQKQIKYTQIAQIMLIKYNNQNKFKEISKNSK